MAGQWELIDGPAGALSVYDVAGRTSSPSSAVVIFHGFPVARQGAAETSAGLPQLAERLAAEVGWRAMAACLRGVGGSLGDFSLSGWLEDVTFLIDHVVATVESGAGLWLVGFGTSGALALCAAAADPRIRGVAGFGVPATFSDWASDPAAMVQFARQVGVVRTPGFPADERAWADGFATIRPVEAIAAIAPRPVLLVHGADDDEVPLTDARTLAEAAGEGAELCLLAGAGHRLRADPRAMAVLVGWLERQAP